MIESKAIVLQQLKYSETSLIVKIYTQKEGLLSFIIKGIRGKKGKLRTAQFQTLNLIDINYKQGQKSQLRHIIDLKITEPFTELLFDPIKRSVAIFMAELIQQSIKEEEPNQELYDFLHNSIQWLDLTQASCTHYHLLFMMRLTKYLGFPPLVQGHENDQYFDLQQGIFTNNSPTNPHYLDSSELKAWKDLLACKPEDINKLNFPNKLKRSMVHALMNYYKLHLINFKELNSHHILQMVFDDE
jgi:DNA repair protein RecO (recombination protein O)